MNLIEIVRKYQNVIVDNSILVDYKLFFNDDFKEICKFVIDDDTNLKELHKVISMIKEKDRKSEFYVNTYGVNLVNDKIYIYADTLWINTTIDLEEILGFFEYFHSIEPSDIDQLSEDELIDEIVTLVILGNDDIKDYKSFIEERKLSKIKSLYWN